jgi:membrane-associated phospholipid phosphatase
MRRRSVRPHPHPLWFVLVSILGVAGFALTPRPAGATPLTGDPDVPAWGGAAAPPSRSFLRRDLDRLASRESLRLLLAGGALALAAHTSEDPDRAEALLDVHTLDGGADAGNVYGNGAVLAGGTLALAAAGFAAGDANLKGAAGEMARALVYTGVTVTALKLGVQRTRPNGGTWSFPSGHTAAAFSVASILAHHFGRLAAIPAYVLAVGTGLGRMEDRKHYLSDVIAGAAVGLTVGRAVAASGDDAATAHANAAGPEFAIGPGGAQVTLHF